MLANIQVLRAVAAMMIVVIHTWTLLRPIGVVPPTWLFAGVDIFFVISGFIMVHMTRQREQRAGQFLLDRVIRIVPVYWLFTLIVYAASRLLPDLPWQASGLDLLRSLAFVPYGKPEHFPPLLYVGWSLNLEMYFYLVFAIGLAAVRRTGARVALVGGLILVPVLLSLGREVTQPWQLYALPIVLEFVLGMVLAVYHDRLVQLSGPVGIGMAAVGAALVVADPLVGFTADNFVRFGVPALLIVAGALVAEARGLRSTARVPLELGAASYVLYLSHPLVASAFNNVQRRVAVLDTPQAAVPLMLIAIGAATVFALIVHRAFERPVSAMLKQRLAIRAGVRQPDIV